MIWNDLMRIEYSKALMKHYNNFYFWGEFLIWYIMREFSLTYIYMMVYFNTFLKQN